MRHFSTFFGEKQRKIERKTSNTGAKSDAPLLQAPEQRLMHQRGAIPAPPNTVGVEGVLDAIARVRHHVAFEDPGPQLLLLLLRKLGKKMENIEKIDRKMSFGRKSIKKGHGDR